MRHLILLVLVLILGCSNNQSGDKSTSKDSSKTVSTLNVDTLSAINIDSLYSWAKKDMNIDSIAIIADSLKIISSSPFVYYPLGKYGKMEELKSKYQMLTMEKTGETTPSGYVDLYRARYKNSFIKFVIGDESRKVEIVYGKIANPEIVFINGIKIGMNKNELLDKFFSKSVPSKSIHTIKVFSTVLGIDHTYTFKDELLTKIELDTDYLFSKN